MNPGDDRAARRVGTTIGGYSLETYLGAAGPVHRYVASRAGVRGWLEVAAEATPQAKGRVLRGGNLVAMVAHDGVARRIEDGVDELGLPFVVLDLQGGVTLDHLSGVVTVGEAVGMLVQVLEALAAVHEGGIVHGGICPGRLYLGAGHRVRLADFSESVLVAARASTPERSPEAAFDAPECARGRATIEPRSDLFSIAATVYFLLARRPVRTSFQGAIAETPSLATVVPGVPPDLGTLIDRALAIDPNLRWGSAREMGGAASWIARGVRGTKLGGLLQRATSEGGGAGPPMHTAAVLAPVASAEETVAAPWGGRPSAALPFARGAGPAMPAPAPLMPREDTGTLAGPQRPRGPTLPFAGAHAPAAVPAQPMHAAHAPQAPAFGAPHSRPGYAAPPPSQPGFAAQHAFANPETQALSEATVAGARPTSMALPFDPRAAAAPPMPAMSAVAPSQDSTGTVFGSRKASGAVMPFGAKPSPSSPGMPTAAPIAMMGAPIGTPLGGAGPGMQAPAPHPGALIPRETYLAVKAAVMQGDRALADVLEDHGVDEIVWHKHEQALRAAVSQDAEQGRTDRAFELSRGVRGGRKDG